MKSRIRFIAIFAAGLGLGALAHYELTRPPKNPTDKTWMDTYSEEKTQEMMLQFQRRLKRLQSAETADDAGKLSQQVEVQRGILDLISKYREAEYAKYAPFTGLAGVLFAAILGALAPGLLGKRNPGNKPNP